MNIPQIITELCGLWEVEFPPPGRLRGRAREHDQELLALTSPSKTALCEIPKRFAGPTS